MLSLHCPSCNRKLAVEDRLAGKQCRCPTCQRVLDVPSASAPFHSEQTVSAPNLSATASLPTPPVQWPAAPLIPGYEVLATIGRGGMGIVYRARHVQLNRVAAIKMILAGPQADEQERLRFRGEAEAIARLRHPNIVQIYEVGDAEGKPFLSLEFIEGGSLQDKVHDEPLPPGAAAQIVEQLAGGVQHAHERGIVHRDLKPHNVLLTADGVAKITDFGLAKFADQGATAGPTQTGQILGTPGYMAPEQAEANNRVVGPAADIYALGAILYRCLTGRPPFQGPTRLETIVQVVSVEPVPPRRLQPKIPRDLETICLKCLQKSPGKRYASAQSLGDDLHRFGAGEPIQARPVGHLERSWRWCVRHPALASMSAAAVVLLLATAFAGVAAALYYADARNQAELKIKADGKAAKAVQDELATREAMLDEKNNQLAKICVREGLNQEAEDPWGALLWYAEALKNDQHNAARAAQHRLRLTQYLRHYPRLHFAWCADDITWARFAPDGRHILVHRAFPFKKAVGLIQPATTRSELRLLDVHSGKTAGPPVEPQFAAERVVLSPDRRSMLLATRGPGFIDPSVEAGVVQVADVATGKLSPAIKHERPIVAEHFSPDGKRFVTIGGEGTARVWDTATGAAISPPLKQTGDVKQAGFLGAGRVYTVGYFKGRYEQEIQVWNADTGMADGPVLRPKSGRNLMLTPDGKRALAAGKEGTQIWNLETGKEEFVWPGVAGVVAFSNDGCLALTLNATRDEAEVWNVETGKKVGLRLPFSCGNLIWDGAFSPDSGRVLVPTDKGSNIFVTLAPIFEIRSGLETCKLRLQPHQEAVYSWFSKDGKRVFTTEKLDHGLGATIGLAALTVWDAASRCQLQPSFSSDQGAFYKNKPMTASPDGRYLVSTSRGMVRVWDLGSDTCVEEPFVSDDHILATQRSLDGRYVLKAEDKSARLWDAQTGQPAGPPLPHAAEVLSLSLSFDGGRALTITKDQKGRLWDTARGQTLGPEFTGRAEFAPDGNTLIIAGTGKEWATIKEYRDGSTGKALPQPGRTIADPQMSFTLPTFARARAFALWDADDKGVRIWNVGKGQAVTPPLPPFQPKSAKPPVGIGGVSQKPGVTFSADGRRVWLINLGDGSQVWDLASGKPVSPPLNVSHGAFSPNGERILAGGTLWNVSTGQQVGPALSGNVTFGANGRYLVVRTEQDDAGPGSLQIRDAQTNEPIGGKVFHGNVEGRLGPRVFGYFFSADGRRLLTYGGGVAKVWDVQTGQALTSGLANDSAPGNIFETADRPAPLGPCFSPDGALVMTRVGRHVRVWEAATGRPVTPPLFLPIATSVEHYPKRKTMLVEKVEFSADGRALQAIDPVLQRRWVWHLTADPRPVEDLVREAELVSGRRLDAAGNTAPLAAAEVERAWRGRQGVGLR